MLSTIFKCPPMRVPLATPRPRERGTARGRREPPCPSCASSAPAAGRSSRNRPGRHAHLPGSRPSLHPRARERRPGRLRCAGPSGFPAVSPVSLTDSRSPRRPRAGPEKAAGSFWCPTAAQQLRQLGDIDGDAPGFVAGEDAHRRSRVRRSHPLHSASTLVMKVADL